MSKLIQRIQQKPGTNSVKSQSILSNQKLPGMQRNKKKKYVFQTKRKSIIIIRVKMIEIIELSNKDMCTKRFYKYILHI